jgi:hypothetical protein
MSLSYRISFLLMFFFFGFINFSYGQVKYFSPDGKQMSEREYQSTITQKDSRSEATTHRNTSIRNSRSETRAPRNNTAEVDKYGRPVFDSEGNRFVYPDQEKQMRPAAEFYIRPSTSPYPAYKSSEPNTNRRIYKGF